MALSTLPVVTSPGGHPIEASPVILVDPAGAYAGGGGGSGDSVDITTLAKEAKQDTAIAALGAPADTEATGNGSVIAVLKRMRTLLGALPLPAGAATSAAQTTANAALGAPADAEATGDGSIVALLKRLRSQLAGLLGVVPQMSSGGHLAVTTAAGGTPFTAFASQACKQLTVFNNTGTVLEAQQGGSGVAVPVFTGQAFTFFGLTNASQIGLRRVDLSTTTVTAQARWEA